MKTVTACKRLNQTRNNKTRRCRKKCVRPKHRKPHTRKCILACGKDKVRSGYYNHCVRKCKKTGTCKK